MNRFSAWLSAAIFLLTACREPMVQTTANCVGPANDSSAQHPKAATFNQILKDYTQKGLPGISVLVEDEYGTWTGAAGMADIAAQVPFAPCTVNKLGSITKMMFASMVFQLAEQNLIDLDEPISKHLSKELIGRVNNASEASLRDLLGHKTGIYDLIADAGFYLAVVNQPNKKWTSEELIRFTYDQPADFPFKSTVKYSNTNTLLASMVIDAIKPAGKDHAAWMHTLVFQKLGLSNTYYHTHDPLPRETARGYFDLYQEGTLTDVSNMITGSGHGFTGVYSNVYDIHRFMRALFVDQTLVSKTSLQAMQQWSAPDTTYDIGIGLLREYKNTGYAGIGHTGGDLGYAAVAHIFPDRNNRMLIYCVNYGTNGDSRLRSVYAAFRDELANALLR
jgi:D-alanyl-D-alanine carboxypeptidase